MGKVSILIYITVAVLILFLISYSPSKPSNHRHRRLKLRSNFTFSHQVRPHHDPVPFDPIVADLELRREDRQWERQYMEHAHPELVQHESDSAPGAESQPEWEDFADAEDYLNDEERFNVTNRLVVLFPRIDVDPADGFVTGHELTQWNLQQAEREVMHRTQRELDVHDKNKDGFVSFAEYEPPSWVLNAGLFLLSYVCLSNGRFWISFFCVEFLMGAMSMGMGMGMLNFSICSHFLKWCEPWIVSDV